MKIKNAFKILLFSLMLSSIFAISATAANLEDYGVASGDVFTYKVVTTNSEGESTIIFMKYTIKDTSTIVGLTADFEWYNGTNTTTYTDEPCYLVLKQSEIQEYLKDTYSTQQYYGDKFVDVIPVYDNPHYSEMWVDIDTGVAVKVSFKDDDGNSVLYELVKWGSGNLQVLYEDANYQGGGGGSSSLPGYPVYILLLATAATISILLKKNYR